MRTFLLALAVSSAPSQAQALLHTLADANPDFGRSVSGVPDADGDGYGDLLVGARGTGAYLFSGATGALLHAVPGGGEFGYDVAGVSDADGDGRGDLLAGAPSVFAGTGHAYLYSGATGALLHTLSREGDFGMAVAGVPDADGDGRGDLLVGAYKVNWSSPPLAGSAYLYSGATGALLAPLASPDSQPGDGFGTAVAGVQDVDGDGRGDLLVGEYNTATTFGASGRAHVYNGATGALLYTLVSPEPEVADYFGATVSGVDDLDGDGRGDLLVGALGASPGGSPTNAGRAYVFSGATGAYLRTLTSPNQQSQGTFGDAVSGVPDTDGDGRGDLLVSGEGRAYLFSGAGGPALFEITPPTAARDVAGVADADGDGRGDLLIGGQQGQAFLYSGGAPPLAPNPEAVAFGGVEIGGTSAPEPVTLTSVHAGTLTVTGLTLAGGDAAAFRVVSAPALPFPLSFGEAFEVEVVFEPMQFGVAEARLVVQTHAGDRSIGLRGQPVLVVTKAADTGDGACGADCSLREAVGASNAFEAPDVIRFAPTLAGDTLVLTRGPLQPRDAVVVDGQELGLTITGGGTTSELFYVSSQNPDARGPFELVGLTLDGAPEVAVFAFFAQLTIRRCTLTRNQLAVRSDEGASTVIEASTISGNGVGLELGGFGGRIAVRNSTVTRNRVGVEETVWPFTGNVTAAGSVLAGNQTDCEESSDGPTLASHGYNVLGTGCPTIGTDVGVAPEDVFALVLDALLADNGGPTLTHALLGRPDNPALDLGGPCGPVDQRGLPAPVDGPDPDADAECDAGSVEHGSLPTAGELSPAAVPETVALHAARPNPFSSQATLVFDVPEAVPVRLVVYDVLGREVIVVVDREVEAGRHAVVLDGRTLPSGSYLVRLEAGGEGQTRRVTLVR